VQDLEAALDQFRLIAADLNGQKNEGPSEQEDRRRLKNRLAVYSGISNAILSA
jgi:hypothetical protein